MQKTFCDHCGKELNENGICKVEIKFGSSQYALGYFYELCEDCENTLKDWLEEENIKKAQEALEKAKQDLKTDKP